MKIIKLLFIFLLIVSCNQKKNAKDLSSNNDKNKQNRVVFDSTKVNVFFNKFPDLKIVQSEVINFYRNKNYTYNWFDGSKINKQSRVLFSKIQNINDEGLLQKGMYLSTFENLMNSNKTTFPNIETELMLSAQYFIFAKKVWCGLSEKETKSIDWHIPRKKLNYGNLLDSIIQGKTVLGNPPIYIQYNLLKNQLKNYQLINKNGGFPLLDKKIIGLKLGDTSVATIDLKKWLFLSKDLSTNDATNLFDANLANAIKKTKERFGLKINADITTNLRNEMNVSVKERIDKIAINMERCRWLPVGNKTDYVVVNIPEYMMHVYENDRLIWSMSAVVGRSNHQTVIFADKIEYVVFSPYWNVPKGILKKEILPGIARNKNYLSQHNMEWFNGNVRQKPGPTNSLGLVKFLFPNNYDIYLHDTPTKSLFDNSNRANSHGCVRLANAEKMANYLLKKDTSWTPEKIHVAMNNGIEQKVKLQKEEAVFIVYLTSWINSNGQLNFRKDIYNRDKRLAYLISNN